jgi:spermidine/putrescine transport system substrate-binding protein
MDYFDSNEAMYAKLKVGSSDYDIIVPSSYMAYVMKRGNMLADIDKNKIPNLKYVDLKYIEKTEDPDMKYSIPYAVSFTGLGYNKSKIADPKPTWNVFGDPKYCHKITMLNDMRESIGSALKSLGYSLNTTNDVELQKAKELMFKWQKNLAAYQNDEAKTSLAYNILSVIQAYNGDINQMEDDNENISFIVPQEGTSIGTDVMVIPAKSKNLGLAYDFVNFMYEPENCKKNMEYIDFLIPNKESLRRLAPQFIEKIIIPDDIYRRSEVIKDLGEGNVKYVNIWEEILAASN